LVILPHPDDLINMKKVLLLFLLILSFTFVFVSCSGNIDSSDDESTVIQTDTNSETKDDYSDPELDDSSSPSESGHETTAPAPFPKTDSDVAYEVSPSIEGIVGEMGDGYIGGSKTNGDSSGQEVTIEPGQLTSSVLYDHDKYDSFLKLLSSGQTEEENGAFYEYQKLHNLTLNRITLHLNSPNLKVSLLDDDGNALWTSVSDKNGTCYLFTKELSDTYSVKVSNDYIDGIVFTVSDGHNISTGFTRQSKNKLQLMFVIDTTGSMMDELSYLKSEISDVISKVSNNGQIDVSLSLLFYRDAGDEYVTLFEDFTDDIQKMQSFISKQSAAGGGDFEEAIQEAMKVALDASWDDTDVTKILIHVADAPSHSKDVASWFESVKSFSEKGIRIVTVASSGIDRLTEFLYRAECIQTNGYYGFLTNHSGIGGDHLDPTIDEELPVEYLNDMLVRIINGIFSGEMAEPSPIQTSQIQEVQNQGDTEPVPSID